MGTKSNYFRHSFSAHQDAKIRRLIEKCGAKGYAIYFVLLEVYCAKLRDDDAENLQQEIDLKLIGSYLKVRSDFVHSCIVVLSELQLIGHLTFNYDQTTNKLRSTMIKLSIPNSLKYYGKYKIVSDENCPNKRKEKETKIKESKRNKNKTIVAKPDSQIPTSGIREAYKKSYFARYGITPIWSAKENAMAKKLVDNVGLAEGIKLAEFYPTFDDRFHAMKKHPFALLVSQADQVRVAMLGSAPSFTSNPYLRELREMENVVEVGNE